MRHPLICLPLTVLLLWLAWLAGSQAIDAFTSVDDWSDDYVRGKATVVGSRAEYSSSSGSRGTYSCQLIVEWTHDGRSYRSEPIWLSGGISSQPMSDECGRARFGEQVPVWVAGQDASEPFVLEPGNRSSQPLTGAFNALQSALFLGLVWLLWRPRKRPSPSVGAGPNKPY